MVDTLTEPAYETLAEAELLALLSALDALEVDAYEAELEAGVLTLEFADGDRFVINSHRAARQIWMAARRCAWHFDWEPQARVWHAQKTHEELWSTLKESLEKKLLQSVPLLRPDSTHNSAG